VSVLSYRTDDLTFADGSTLPVSLAEVARVGDLDELKRLVANGRAVDEVADLNARNAAGDAPIDYAFDATAAELLIEAGAEGEPPTLEVAASPELDFYSDPLFQAVTKANVAEIRRLVGEGADVNLPLSQGEILLHYAAALGNPEVLTVLIELGADLDARSRAGKKPIDLAWRDAAKDVLRR